MSKISLQIDEGQRQLVLMALANLSIALPGFDFALNQIALEMDNREQGRAILYDQFRKLKDLNDLHNTTDLKTALNALESEQKC